MPDLTAAIKVDLNSDVGEAFGAYTLGDDDAILDIVTSANVACGFHAGDPEVMAHTFVQARSKGVAVGAHPGYLDLWGFGRRIIPHSAGETDEGHLVSRKLPGAVIHDADTAAARVVRMMQARAIETQSGVLLKTPIDSICLHSDTPGAVTIAAQVRRALERNGVVVRAFATATIAEPPEKGGILAAMRRSSMVDADLDLTRPQE